MMIMMMTACGVNIHRVNVMILLPPPTPWHFLPRFSSFHKPINSTPPQIRFNSLPLSWHSRKAAFASWPTVYQITREILTSRKRAKNLCTQRTRDITFLALLLEEHSLSPLPHECKTDTSTPQYCFHTSRHKKSLTLPSQYIPFKRRSFADVNAR